MVIDKNLINISQKWWFVRERRLIPSWFLMVTWFFINKVKHILRNSGLRPEKRFSGPVNAVPIFSQDGSSAVASQPGHVPHESTSIVLISWRQSSCWSSQPCLEDFSLVHRNSELKISFFKNAFYPLSPCSFDTFSSSRFLVVCKFSPRLQHADHLRLTNQVKSSFCLYCILIMLFTFFFKSIIICILVFI